MIIAIANQKGGVGKSTTTAALAANLGKMGKRVLVVDMDPQANCTTILGIPGDEARDRPNMFSVMVDVDDIRDAIIAVAENVDLVPSHISLAASERGLHLQTAREGILSRKLRPLAEGYDVVLIDSPPSLGVFTYNIFTACDTVLVPILSEPLALDGISLLLDAIEEVRNTDLNPNCDAGGVVMTMYDQRRNIDKSVREATYEIFPDVVFETTIPRDVRLVEMSDRADLTLLDGDSNAAIAYRQLAQEVVDRWRI